MPKVTGKEFPFLWSTKRKQGIQAVILAYCQTSVTPSLHPVSSLVSSQKNAIHMGVSMPLQGAEGAVDGGLVVSLGNVA